MARTLLVVPDCAGDLRTRQGAEFELHKGVRLIHEVRAAEVPGLDLGKGQTARDLAGMIHAIPGKKRPRKADWQSFGAVQVQISSDEMEKIMEV